MFSQIPASSRWTLAFLLVLAGLAIYEWSWSIVLALLFSWSVGYIGLGLAAAIAKFYLMILDVRERRRPDV
jgi:hypothetical protein